jgi:His/Glu/Gln/Arg/opine family amino acid ABC transporter permease subunit
VKLTEKLWFWKILLAVILILSAAMIWGSVSRIDYEWRWYRVPQYFLYQSEDPVKIPFDGRVASIKTSGGDAKVTLVSETGEQVEMVVDNKSIPIAENEDLFEGDTIGYEVEWRMGPLLTGLWTTLWISAAASVLGLIIGMVAGLMKISKNYTVSTLAAIYVEIIRGTPLLVQIFIAYFFFGTVFNLIAMSPASGRCPCLPVPMWPRSSGPESSLFPKGRWRRPIAGHEPAPGDDGHYPAPGLQTDSAAAVGPVHQPDQGFVAGFGYRHYRPDQVRA